MLGIQHNQVLFLEIFCNLLFLNIFRLYLVGFVDVKHINIEADGDYLEISTMHLSHFFPPAEMPSNFYLTMKPNMFIFYFYDYVVTGKAFRTHLLLNSYF